MGYELRKLTLTFRCNVGATKFGSETVSSITHTTSLLVSGEFRRTQRSTAERYRNNDKALAVVTVPSEAEEQTRARKRQRQQLRGQRLGGGSFVVVRQPAVRCGFPVAMSGHPPAVPG